MNVPEGHHLSDVDIRVLSRVAAGEHTFRPGTGSSEGEDFDLLTQQLRSLRDRGLIRLPDTRIMRNQRGPLLSVGPCELTQAGWQALAQDRGSGPG